MVMMMIMIMIMIMDGLVVLWSASIMPSDIHRTFVITKETTPYRAMLARPGTVDAAASGYFSFRR